MKLAPDYCKARRAISRADLSDLSLPFISLRRGVRDSPKPGDIEFLSQIFASTTEIATGNDAATMFTQTPRVETILQDSRTCSRTLYS